MKKDSIEKSLAITSFVLPTALLGILIFSTFFLPDKIAIHFDSNGNVTRFGGQYELLILSFAIYLIPMIMAVIFANVNNFLSKSIGLAGSILVSLTYYVVQITNLVKVFKNSNNAVISNEHWVSFAIAILGFICIIVSHILPFFKQNLISKKKEIKYIKSSAFNKINVVFSVLLFLLGLTICFGCAVLKNYYSFILIVASIVVYGLMGFFSIRKNIRGKKKVNNYEND